ncbi:MAG: AAA family ATPase [Betaproteobacteria bacterium]
MADASTRSLNLLLTWQAERLTAVLSDGHALGCVAELTAAEDQLMQLAAEAELAWLGDAADRQRVGRALLQRLIPEPIVATLAARPGSALDLQLSPPLIALPWEWALDSGAALDQRRSLNRHILSDPTDAPAPLLGDGRHRQHLRVLIVHQAFADKATLADVGDLAGRLDAMDNLSTRVLALDGERAGPPLLRYIGDCDVLHVVGDLLQLLRDGAESGDGMPGPTLALADIALLDEPPRLLVLEDRAGTAPQALPGQRLRHQQAVALTAGQAGINVLFHDRRPHGPPPGEALAKGYAELARGRLLGEAVSTMRHSACCGDVIAYVDPQALLAPETVIRHPDDHVRQTTVLCYDLVDSTNILRKLGAERYSETLDRFHGNCAEVVGRWGGRANAPQGNDGVMCFFGLPIAHEDAPAMALKAALALSESVAQLQLQVRVGVVTGPVVVRAGVPMGEPIHLAARLATLATPGGAVVSDSTRAIVKERFRFVALTEPLALKGFDSDVLAFALAGEQRDASAGAAAAWEAPLVGRQTEFEHLQAIWADACKGRFKGLLVSGEAGIGKTRLVREFRRSLTQKAHHVIELRCDPEHAGSAFRPLIETLSFWFGLSEGEHAHELQQKLDARLQGFQNRQHIIAGLMLVLDPTATANDAQDLKVPEKIRQQIIEALLLWADHLTLRGPVCLIIEDHNWLDPSSRELLQQLKANSAQRPLLLLLTQRSEPGQPVQRPDGLALMELGSLGTQDTELLLHRICDPEAIPATLIESVAAKTDGVPLYIEETARALVARVRQLSRRPGSGAAATPQLMPGKVQDLLMARLDRLNAAKVVAQFGSSIGRHFSQAMIQAVCAHDMAPVRVEGVLFHLESLVRAGILGQSTVGKEVRYQFRHALMQDAAYESLWERDRRRCHGTVARVISESFPGLAASQPEVLARHCSAAGLPEPAIQYWENAARLAISRAAQVEASQHLDAALALIEALPSGTARDRTELRLLLLQAGQGIALYGYGADQVGVSYRRAEALSRQCGDNRALLRVQFGLEGYLFMRGEFQRAHEVAAGASELLQTVADPMRRVQAQWAVANLVFHQGLLPEAVVRMDACLADYGKLEQRAGQMQDPAVMSLGYSALAQWTLGFADDALARAEQALALATRLKHPLSLGEAHGLKAMLHCYRRDYLDTLECAQRAIHVCESSGFAVWLAHARIMHGWAVAHLGNPQAGLAEMAAGYTQWTSTGAVVTCAFYLGVQAEGLALAGEPVQGLTLLDQALAIATRCGERYFEAELCRLQGELLIHSKNNSKETNQDKAQDWFLRSIEVSRELGLSAFEARAAQSLAALWQSQGRMAEAQTLLTSANKVSMIS